MALKVLFSWATLSFSRSSMLHSGGVNSTHFLQNVTVGLIERFLFIGRSLLHISVGCPHCGFSWHSSTPSCKSKIIQSIPFSAEPTQAASLSTVDVACRVLLYYAYQTIVREYEVWCNTVFTVEPYSKNKSYETSHSEFRSRFLGVSVRSKTIVRRLVKSSN